VAGLVSGPMAAISRIIAILTRFLGVGAAGFVVPPQPPAAGQPAEGSLNHPAAGQDVEAVDVVAALDHLQAHAEFVVGPVDQTVVETASASTGRL
jgi:hypothetical protein